MLWKGFQKPKRLEVDRGTLTDRYGRFYAQPFERGFGTTIGNALRRVLLSSIEGAAITAVKIEGVLHEFSPIPGALEDTTDIILNLKRVPFKLHSEEPKTVYLKATGEKAVTAADIETHRQPVCWRRAQHRDAPQERARVRLRRQELR
jgi:DNA-directed RNA polymerase subunit alpha